MKNHTWNNENICKVCGYKREKYYKQINLPNGKHIKVVSHKYFYNNKQVINYGCFEPNQLKLNFKIF